MLAFSPYLECPSLFAVFPNHNFNSHPLTISTALLPLHFCSPFMLSTDHSLKGNYYLYPSYLVHTSIQSGFTPSPDSDALHHPLSAPATSLGLQHPSVPEHIPSSVGIKKHCLVLVIVSLGIIIATYLTYLVYTSIKSRSTLSPEISERLL